MRLEACLTRSQLQNSKNAPGVAYESYSEGLRWFDAAEHEEAKTVGGVLVEPGGPRSDYQDALRAAFFRTRGEAEEAIAARLRRPLTFVRSCAGS
eukprot:CAMPEP_0171271506 /NCGR_PEP_ID=MMETSP0790-20130122/61266_1 /TAXON_ID=2925 /ORGANISM="Alexandrium catenella, Strain OF101" /LENGTH=94 /DNA_ID=CAMNT_0011740389 /DNA_START=34 /DNA_END=315 /DNA_ORIENTATION=+